MFTGIVSGMGTVESFDARHGGARLTLSLPAGWGRISAGESVCVAGVCLTAAKSSSRWLLADLSPETMSRSSLGALRPGKRLNLERALRWGDRLSGHFLLGHVDGVARILAIERSGNSWTYRFTIPAGQSRFVVEKGSVALDGVSLTVARRRGRAFDVAVIPETHRRTTIGGAQPGDRVNFEADVFARYGRAGSLSRARRALRR